MAIAPLLTLFFGAWSGLGLICLQSPTERRRLGLLPQALMPRLLVMLVANAQLMFSLAAAIQQYGIGFGLILWVSMVGLFGLMLALILPYVAHVVIHSAIIIAAIMLTLAVF
jgi:FtsH-binding integral membrane protein